MFNQLFFMCVFVCHVHIVQYLIVVQGDVCHLDMQGQP